MSQRRKVLPTVSRTRLENLNDDCLLEIFSKKLNVADLCSLAETCRRFQSVTPRLFRRSFYFDAKKYWEFSFKTGSHCADSGREVVRVWRNFGNCFTEVSGMHRFVLDLTATYGGDNLTYLFLNDMHLTEADTQKMGAVFQRLQTLVLCNISIDGNELLTTKMDSLVRLQLLSVKNDQTILTNVFPNLKEFAYVPSSDYSITDETLQPLKNFIELHNRLKSLQIQHNLRLSWKAVIEAIGKNRSELEELNIVGTFYPECPFPPLIPLLACKSLTKVSLSRGTLKHFKDFRYLSSLRKLRLEHIILPKDVNQFACLNKLVFLSMRFCQSYGMFKMTDIVRQLGNVEKLILEDLTVFSGKKLVLDRSTYFEIEKIVEERSKTLSLKCPCIGMRCLQYGDFSTDN